MTPVITEVFVVDLDAASRLAGLDRAVPESERDAPPALVSARAALRIVLGERLGCAPAAVPISRRCERCGDPAHGRPAVDDAHVSFSLSHTAGRALIALVAGTTRVGVDVERVAPRTRLDALAARTLDAAAYAAWRAADADEQLVRFLQSWTAKEAYLKGIGVGIATSLRDVPAQPPGWSIRPVDAGAAYVAAVAVEHDAVDVVVRELPVEQLSVSAGTGR